MTKKRRVTKFNKEATMAKQTFTHYVYQVKKQNKVLATYVFEQDAIDHVQKTGGEIFTIGAY